MKLDCQAMSTRLINLLAWHDLITYEQILDSPSWTILRLRNMGKKSFNELLIHLRKHPKFENSRLNSTLGVSGNFIEKRIETLKKWTISAKKNKEDITNKIKFYEMEINILEKEIEEK